MAISTTQRTIIDLSDLLSDVPESSKQTAIESIGEEIVGSIKDYLEDAKSPVEGYGKFEKLSPKYAEKKGSNIANLYLEGDLWDSLSYEVDGSDLIIGVDDSQEGKADGHNNFSGDSNLPLRRFLADEGETFKELNKITNKIIPLYETGVQSAIDELINISQERLMVSSLNAPQVLKRESASSITLEGITESQLKKFLRRR